MTVDKGVVSAHSAAGQHPQTQHESSTTGNRASSATATTRRSTPAAAWVRRPSTRGTPPACRCSRGRRRHRQRHPHPADAESRRQPCALHLRQLLRFGRRTRRQADLPQHPRGGQRPHRRSRELRLLADPTRSSTSPPAAPCLQGDLSRRAASISTRRPSSRPLRAGASPWPVSTWKATTP